MGSSFEQRMPGVGRRGTHEGRRLSCGVGESWSGTHAWSGVEHAQGGSTPFFSLIRQRKDPKSVSRHGLLSLLRLSLLHPDGAQLWDLQKIRVSQQICNNRWIPNIECKEVCAKQCVLCIACHALKRNRLVYVCL